MCKLDINTVKQRFQRYCELNSMRYSKAIEVMPSKARFILSLLPLYLHYNNELLPMRGRIAMREGELLMKGAFEE